MTYYAKQTQFVELQMNVTFFPTKDYQNETAFSRLKYKPNQTQSLYHCFCLLFIITGESKKELL
jgi:hypothetical protein